MKDGYKIRYYTSYNKSPFEIWFRALSHEQKGIIARRLNRVKIGNFGNYKKLKDGIYELKEHSQGGLRVYYTIRDNTILLLTGGKKKTQSKDIRKAKEYWFDYLKKGKNVH